MIEKPSFLPSNLICPKCGDKGEFWQTHDNRLKCKKCRYLFTPKENILGVPDKILKKIISEFLLEHSTNIILERIKISKYKLLKTLSLIRVLITREVVKSFGGKIKVENGFFEKELEKILKNKKSNEIKNQELKNEPKIIGIFCDQKKCFAKILPEIQEEEVKMFLKNKENNFRNFENWHRKVALIIKGSLYRLTKPTQKIDDLSIFWGYLKRKLSERGGIKTKKLPFYLGEFCWRFNNRKKTLKEKEGELLKLVLGFLKECFCVVK